jgi:two-component system OmpR family sensor kinase
MTAVESFRRRLPVLHIGWPFPRPDRMAVRLSVSFVLLFAIVFTAVVVITLYYAERNFQTSIDTTLSGVAETAGQRLTHGTEPLEVVRELSSLTQYVVILDAKDHMVAHSENLSGIAMPERFKISTRNTPTFQTFSTKAGRLRSIHYPVLQNGGVTGFVVVASPQPDIPDVVQSLAIVITLAGLLGLIVAVIGTVWLSVRESRPLQTLAEDVKATADSGFELDVPASNKGSVEARQLREAFAVLVDRQQEMLTRERAFFADSSHVLRTPLAVLQGDIEQLEQGIYGKERQETVAQARSAIETMSRAVNGLLLLAREPDASPASSWEVVELSPLLQDLVREAGAAAPMLTIRGNIAAGIEVAGDPHQLRDLFGNLIENAWRYTPPDGSVAVSLRRDGEDALVVIRDTGIGLAAGDANRLKERFYRSRDARRMFPGGSGLGLAIADRVARLHRGSLDLSGRPGGGAEARVRLPLLGE